MENRKKEKILFALHWKGASMLLVQIPITRRKLAAFARLTLDSGKQKKKCFGESSVMLALAEQLVESC